LTSLKLRAPIAAQRSNYFRHRWISRPADCIRLAISAFLSADVVLLS
jgi:hypothetical protein